jgi:hypothetical protein
VPDSREGQPHQKALQDGNRRAEAWQRRGVEPAHDAPGLRRQLATAALIAFGVSGFGSFALEVAWTRILLISFSPTFYSFAATLACLLLGSSSAAGWSRGSSIATRTSSHCSRGSADLISWAWATNGCFSVLGIFSTRIVALLLGFSHALILGLLVYLLVIACVRAQSRVGASRG